MYAIPNRNEDFEETVLHEGYNSGQVLWLPTERVINGTLRSLLLGKREEEEGLNNSILKMVCGMRVLSLQVSVLCMPETGNVKQKAVVM